jgi:hypothetical protein
MDTWLREFVERHMAAQVAEDPRAAPLLAEVGGMRLFGSIGAEVFLRPDGTTVAVVETPPGEPDEWQLDADVDHIAAINIALKRFPELARLLPHRPGNTPDCAACDGTGYIYGVVCGTCSGLGWIGPRAT